MAHPMMPRADHDERAGQLFTRDLKGFIASTLNPSARALATAVEQETGPAETFDAVEGVFERLVEHAAFRDWISLKRTAQEMMWASVAETVDRQLDALTVQAEIIAPKGSLTLDPEFRPPAYATRMDTHLMPGGYTVEEGEGSIRQGALMDAGGAVYQLGRPMGPRNDRAALAAVTHLVELYPDIDPRRIIDLGTGIGRGVVAAACHFPEAQVYGVDIGASVLRYAHARAERLEARVHLVQDNAEHTRFADGAFDLVMSSAIFHETSDQAIPRLIQEMYRLLRPGGVCVNVEVPCRYWECDILGKLEAEWEMHFNNESAYRAAVSADFAALFETSGFKEHHVGWQNVAAEPGERGFSLNNPKPAFALYVASARKV